MGEGYHNFHHQFPMDYRNAFRWYQYDPTKWFIGACQYVGLASHLREFPSNEIEKGALTMKLKELKQVQDSLAWPVASSKLSVVCWDTCKSFHVDVTFSQLEYFLQSKGNQRHAGTFSFRVSSTMFQHSSTSIREGRCSSRRTLGRI